LAVSVLIALVEAAAAAAAGTTLLWFASSLH